MTDNLTPEQHAARESARNASGQFGEQPHTAPEVALSGGHDTVQVIQADGTSVAVEALPFTPAYPTDPEWEPGEMAVGYEDAVECLCGNDTSGDGFGQVGADGRYSDLRESTQHPELSDNLDFYVCHLCGRVYHGEATETAGAGGQVAVVAKYLRSPEFDKARDLYWAALDDDD